MPITGDYECFSDDWRRTDPDLVFYLPKEPQRCSEAVDHVLVEVTPGGDLLAMWQNGTQADLSDHSVLYTRSSDGGRSWDDPEQIDPPGPKPGQVACFGFPVISASGRIYCFYNKGTGVGTAYTTSFLRCKYSDDDGRTWIDGEIEIPYRHTKYSHPDPKIGADNVIWQKPIRDANGKHLVGVTRWTPKLKRPSIQRLADGQIKDFGTDCHCEFLRFENIDMGPEPRDIEVTWLPDDENLISVPLTLIPDAPKDLSYCQEPSIVLLPDNRLFTSMRTQNGEIWYTVSHDNGHSWRVPEPLRFQDGGDVMLNPIAPTPIFKLNDGRYLQFLQNHDGFAHGGRGPTDNDNRGPQFVSVGEFRNNAHQPIWFSEPLLVLDTHKVGVFPFYRSWLSMYASLTEHNGERILWYADRKLFGLGRYITDEMLAPLTVPNT